MVEFDQSTTSPAEVAFSRVLVVGAGTMGSGIAQVVAEAGIETVLFDSDVSSLERGLASISSRWDRLQTTGRRTPDDVARYRGHLRAGDLSFAGRSDLIVEAIVEKPEAKLSLLEQLAPLAGADTLIASNTSSISITALARASGRPDRFLGLHFFNPVPALPLVEVVRGLETSEKSLTRAVEFVRQIGKAPVIVNDSPGFVANRVLLPMINEAIFLLQEGVTPRESIDEIMKLGMSHPMGPLALADLIGLDVCLDILETLHRDLGEDKYRPAPLLRRMVAGGMLGRKSGQGFYSYEPS